jgi:hypothetical protein
VSTPLSRETATIGYKSATASTAQTPSGISRLSGVNPNSFALSPWSQSASGGLSTVIRPFGSAEMKTKLCHERNIDFTAAE